jgi:hypothetical protein
MKIYIPYYENRSWHTATLNSLDCNLYKHKGGGYTIFAYNNAVAYNGDNVYNNELGSIAYQSKNYGNANIYKVDVEKLNGKIESEVNNMDKLTELKRLKLIRESLKCELNMPNKHKDIKQMYALISDMAIASENSDDIKALITTKTALDFLVRGILK